jgi:hypothetical protein
LENSGAADAELSLSGGGGMNGLGMVLVVTLVALKRARVMASDAAGGSAA